MGPSWPDVVLSLGNLLINSLTFAYVAHISGRTSSIDSRLYYQDVREKVRENNDKGGH